MDAMNRGDGGDGERVVGFTHSKDFENWTPAKNVLRDYDRDANNPAGDAQTHDMIVFPTGGIYIGLLGAMYFPEVNSEYHVRQHVELAWSPDGENWTRIQEGTPFIENTPTTENVYGKMPYDWGTIFASAPIFFEDETVIYYGACDWYFFDWRKGYLARAIIRPDGWAGYEPIEMDKPAVISTKPVFINGKQLQIAADIDKNGYVKLMSHDQRDNLLVESQPVEKSISFATIKWEEGFSIGELNGDIIKITIEIMNAKFNSFGFK